MQRSASPYLGSSSSSSGGATLFAPELGLFALATGCARGRQDGAVAKLAIEGVKRASRHIPDELYLRDRSLAGREKLLGWLSGTMAAINFDLNDRARRVPELAGLQCSLELLLLRGDGAFLAHIGGGRSLLLRGERLYQLTEDHSYANHAITTGELSLEEVTAHPARDRLSRALGPLPNARPDTLFFEVCLEDLFLLGSHDLHAPLRWEQLQQSMSKAHEGSARELCAAADAAGGGGEPSAILIRLEQGGAVEAIIGSERARAALARCSIFAELSPQELLRVQKIALARHIEAGEFYIREGELVDCLQVIVEGRCSVWIQGQQIGAGEPGDPGGAIGLVAAPSAISNRAETPMLCLDLPVAALHELRKSDARVMSKIAFGALDRMVERGVSVARSLARYRKVYGPTP